MTFLLLNNGQAWWHAPVVPATPGAEAGRWLESENGRSAWVTVWDAHLKKRMRLNAGSSCGGAHLSQGSPRSQNGVCVEMWEGINERNWLT